MDLKIKGGQEFTDEEHDDINQFIIMFREKHGRDVAVLKSTDLEIKRGKYKNEYMQAYTMDEIVEIVCGIMNISEQEFISKSRKRDLVISRSIFYYVARLCGYCLREIGERAGGKDHTTVIHGINCLKALIETRDVRVTEIYKMGYDKMGSKLPLLAYINE